MKSHLTIPIAVLVAALLCFLFKWVQTAGANRREGESTRAVTHSGEHSSTNETGQPSKLPRPDYPTLPAAIAASHTPEQLKDFIIADLFLEDASLRDALDRLLNEYRDICANTGERPVTFEISVDGQAERSINLSLSQTSFLTALRLIATQAGMKLWQDGTDLTFSSLEDSLLETRITKKHAVSSDFENTLRNLVDPNLPINNPFSVPPEKKEVAELLRLLGVLRSPEASATFLPANSQLVVSGDSIELDQLNTVLDALSTTPVMIKSEIKFFDSPTELDLPLTPLDNAEYQVVMRELSQTPGTSITTQPSIVSRPGQTATIEVGRELIQEDQQHPGHFETNWIGTRIDVNTGGYGFDVRGDIDILDRNLVGEDPAGGFSTSRSNTTTTQSPGHTVLISSTTPEGNPRYAFVTYDFIDTAGRPVSPEVTGSFESPFSFPVLDSK